MADRETKSEGGAGDENEKMDKKGGIKGRMMANRKCKDCGKSKKNCDCC